MTTKKILAAFAAMVLLSVFAISCTPKDDSPEEATLSLSSSSLVLTNAAQDPTAPQITVTTNQPKFTVSSNASWLQAEASGTGVKISALANELGKDRKGEVLVFAGGLVEKIVVTQSAADIVLSVSPTDINVARAGREILIAVKTNSEVWNVETEADWLKIDKVSEFVKVEVTPNSAEDTRVGKIIAKAGTKIEEIVITQAGMGGQKFMLPLLEQKVNIYKIFNHENTQGNYFIKHESNGLSAFGIPAKNDFYQFAYSSPVFTTVTYVTDIATNTMYGIQMLSDDPESIGSDELRTFLTNAGFTLEKATEEGYVGERAEEGYTTKVAVVNTEKECGILFAFEARQTKEYKTFEKFPWDQSPLLDNPQWPSSKIVESEKAEGHTVVVKTNQKHPQLTEMIQVTLKESSNQEVPHFRLYFMNVNEEKGTSTDLTAELLTIWTNFELMAYESNETFILTNEFKELLNKNGFVKYFENEGKVYWYNKEKKIMVLPGGARFSDVNNAEPVCRMNYFHYEEKEAGSTSKQVSLLEMSRRIDMQDKQLGKLK